MALQISNDGAVGPRHGVAPTPDISQPPTHFYNDIPGLVSIIIDGGKYLSNDQAIKMVRPFSDQSEILGGGGVNRNFQGHQFHLSDIAFQISRYQKHSTPSGLRGTAPHLPWANTHGYYTSTV
jgi:hypothetical protein